MATWGERHHLLPNGTACAPRSALRIPDGHRRRSGERRHSAFRPDKSVAGDRVSVTRWPGVSSSQSVASRQGYVNRRAVVRRTRGKWNCGREKRHAGPHQRLRVGARTRRRGGVTEGCRRFSDRLRFCPGDTLAKILNATLLA